MLGWIIAACLLVSLIVTGLVIYNNTLRKENIKNTQTIVRLSSAVKNNDFVIDQLKLEQEKMQTTINSLTSENKELLALDQDKNLLTERLATLKSQMEEKLQNLTTINEKIAEKNKLLNDFESIYIQKNESLQFIQEEKLKVQNDINDLKTSILTYNDDIAKLQNIIKTLESQMNDVKDSYRLALAETERQHSEDEKNDGSGGWIMTITLAEKSLVELLLKLEREYPALKADFAAVIWKRVWLPKIQDLCNREHLDGVRGIYRLVLIADENVCYVGQAANIKERWYQHIKKMVGVDPKGNEKLYNDEFSPDDFRWEVVERLESGTTKDINEREHYWIEFFGCKEYGLNKKR